MSQRAFRDDNLCSETDNGSWTGFWVILFMVAAVLAFVCFQAARATSSKLAHETFALKSAELETKSAKRHAIDLIAKADDLRVERDELQAELKVAVAAAFEIEKELIALRESSELSARKSAENLAHCRERAKELEERVKHLSGQLAECRAALFEIDRFGPAVPIEPMPDVAPPVPEEAEPVPETKPAPPAGCQCGCGKPVCQCHRCKPKRKP